MIYKKKEDTKYDNKTSCSRNIRKIMYNENKIRKAIIKRQKKKTRHLTWQHSRTEQFVLTSQAAMRNLRYVFLSFNCWWTLRRNVFRALYHKDKNILRCPKCFQVDKTLFYSPTAINYFGIKPEFGCDLLSKLLHEQSRLSIMCRCCVLTSCLVSSRSLLNIYMPVIWYMYTEMTIKLLQNKGHYSTNETIKGMKVMKREGPKQ